MRIWKFVTAEQVILGVLLAGYGVLSYTQIRVWETPLTLWQHAAAVAPCKPRVLLNYATALRDDGLMKESVAVIELARQCAERAWVREADRHDALTRITEFQGLNLFGQNP